MRSTREDILRTFRKLDLIAGETKYQLGMLGSAIVKGEGSDQDFLFAAAEDCKTPCWKVATAILQQPSVKRILDCEDVRDDGSAMALCYIDNQNKMIDVLIVGLP